MKITYKCLIDASTNEPLVVSVPKTITDEYVIDLRRGAYESGLRFKMGFSETENITQDDT